MEFSIRCFLMNMPWSPMFSCPLVQLSTLFDRVRSWFAVRVGDFHYFAFVPCLCEGVVHVHKFVGVQRSPVSLTRFSVVVLSLFLLVHLVWLCGRGCRYVLIVELVGISILGLRPYISSYSDGILCERGVVLYIHITE